MGSLDEAVEDSKKATELAAERRVRATVNDSESMVQRNLETCVFKMLNGDVRTGHRTLRSNGIHAAGTPTVDLMASKFVTDGTKNTLLFKDDLKSRAKSGKVQRLDEKIVGKLLGNLKDCKAAGVSGWRNSRLKLICSTPEGLRSLTSRVRIWITGKVPDHMADIWRVVLGIPLRKGEDGMDVRPILIGESLTSLPGAYLQYVTRPKVGKLFASIQFGIGVPSAPETMIGVVQALTKLRPQDAFVALDMINAFGEISRAEILEEVVEYIPELGPFSPAIMGWEWNAGPCCEWVKYVGKFPIS